MVTWNQTPGRDEVRLRLHALLTGLSTREDVADWASNWVLDPLPTVDDPKVWQALKQLAGADLRISPVDYLHSESDFHVWLDELGEGE